MIDDYLVRKSFVLKRVEDGYLISDLDLVVLLLSCFDEFSCVGAFENPENPGQILFKVTSANPDKLVSVMKSLTTLSTQIKTLTSEEQSRINFANKMIMIRNNLKILIDKVKSRRTE